MKTNRDYFSWSQYSLFKSSKLQFYKRYVLGEQLFLPAFDKGKEFADYRETGEIPHYVDDPLLEAVSKAIPIIGKAEYKIEVEFGGINFLSYIDELKLDLTEFAEYKTGKNPWDQKQVDEHKQLDFYAFCIYILSDFKIIPKCKLRWIETEEVTIGGEKKLMYTGNIETFEKQFTIIDIENIAVELVSTYHEIQAYEYEEIELEESITDRYIYLLDEQKKIGDELNLIKLKVLDELNTNKVKYAVNNKGRFSISERKSPIYSKELLTKEKKYKNEIDKLKKAEKDSPNIEYSITESLLFKKI